MDRIDAGSEASSALGTRTSYHGDYVSPSGYPSSLSVYNAFDAKPVSRDGYGLASGFSDPLRRDGVDVKEGHAEPLSRDGYGGYSYSSSYDDMRKSAHEGRLPYSRQFEDMKPFEASAYGKYGYGADEGSSLRASYKDPSFDSSLAPYYKSLHRASSDPRTSGLYGDDGSMSESRHHDLSYLGTADRYESQYDYSGLNRSDLLNKPNVLPFEPSAAVRELYAMQPHTLTYPHKDAKVNFPYRTPQEGATGAATEYQQSNGLSRKYDSNFSGMFPTFGVSGDWSSAGGGVGDGWQQSGSLLSNAQEPYALGRVGNGSSVMDGSVYPDLRDLDKFGMSDGGGLKQSQPDTREKGIITSLPSEIGSKIVENNKGSMRMPGIDLRREAKEKKKRQSRWEPVEENEKNAQNGSEKKKKSRWSQEEPPAKEVNLSDILKGVDSDVIALRAQLIFINRKLQSGKVVDDRPEAERSPSPEPVFDNFGYRVNTREYRARERLTKVRQRIIARLAEKSPTSKPSPDFKQSKFSRKLYIPVDKHPDYNFIGLIIGPRGHTQKQMEKESGAKIFIRGKGSIREGSSTLTLVNENENLHVLIEADTEDSVNKAAGMVEKLLVPVGDGQNEHKKAQLRELASLNGTFRSSESCHVCKEAGHVAKDCPMAGLTAGSSAAVVHKGGTHQDDEHCHVCKGHGHLSKDCPLSGPTSGSLLKGGSLGSGGHQVTELDSWINNGSDNTLLYVAFLPLSVNDVHLRSLFSPFGQVVHAKVMRHLTTGISKSYGFVKFLDAADAAQAVALMNGYKLDGKVLLVKLKTNDLKI